MNKTEMEATMMINMAKIIRELTETKEQFNYYMDRLLKDATPPRAEENPPE